MEQGGGEKGGIGGSSSSLNSSASEESNRLQQHQQQNSRLRSSLLHSFSTNDASIGEYKYTVTVDNQSLKITGTNLDLVRVWIFVVILVFYTVFFFCILNIVFFTFLRLQN